jgi:hypothetical protein
MKDKAWVTFTRRTNNPKLAWLERRLSDAGIQHRRNGESFHAPILEIQACDTDAAWDILDPVDDYPDDHLRFVDAEVIESFHEHLKDIRRHLRSWFWHCASKIKTN